MIPKSFGYDIKVTNAHSKMQTESLLSSEICCQANIERGMHYVLASITEMKVWTLKSNDYILHPE